MDVNARKYRFDKVVEPYMTQVEEQRVFTSENPKRKKEIVEKLKKALAPFR